MSWAALKRVPGLEIPEPARQELQKRSDACRMQAMRHCIHAGECAEGFQPRRNSRHALERAAFFPLKSTETSVCATPTTWIVAVTPEICAGRKPAWTSLGWRLDPPTGFP